jgi:hypothetical protein
MLKVAYIDDDITERELAIEQGFNCYSPNDYKKAINQNDVIVTDMLLGSDKMLKAIIAKAYGKPLVLTSGLSVLREYYNVKYLPFVNKPVQMQEVLDAI